jgi:outer membrane protein assembly factor BamB
LDGTVYCGCYNGKLYALYPNNGTLKWSFITGDWVARGPCIANDGTIIFGSWDGHLYACYPNGTLKWKTSVGAVTTPVIGPDGTIYVASHYLSAINPDDGSIKWSYDVPNRISGGNPCVSADGIVYCGTMEPGYILAINPDGTERWRKYIGECLFAPIIGEDGTIYIGSSNKEYEGGGYILTGYLHAFNDLDIDAPSEPVIIGPNEGKTGVKYEFSFSASSPLDKKLYYFVDWGDKDVSGWIGPYDSGELVSINHSIVEWNQDTKVYNIRVKVKDEDNRWGPWGYHDFNIPRNRVTHGSVWIRFLDMFPILERILDLWR